MTDSFRSVCLILKDGGFIDHNQHHHISMSQALPLPPLPLPPTPNPALTLERDSLGVSRLICEPSLESVDRSFRRRSLPLALLLLPRRGTVPGGLGSSGMSRLGVVLLRDGVRDGPERERERRRFDVVSWTWLLARETGLSGSRSEWVPLTSLGRRHGIHHSHPPWERL